MQNCYKILILLTLTTSYIATECTDAFAMPKRRPRSYIATPNTETYIQVPASQRLNSPSGNSGHENDDTKDDTNNDDGNNENTNDDNGNNDDTHNNDGNTNTNITITDAPCYTLAVYLPGTASYHFDGEYYVFAHGVVSNGIAHYDPPFDPRIHGAVPHLSDGTNGVLCFKVVDYCVLFPDQCLN